MTIEGKNKFIPQAEEFVHLLSPKRIIPMHHWSDAYLQDFVAALEAQSSTGKNYQITNLESSEYTLSGTEHQNPVKVICLKRSSFTDFKDAN